MRLVALVVSTAVTYWLVAIAVGIVAECGPASLCAHETWWLGFADWQIFSLASGRLAVFGLGLGTVVTIMLYIAGTRSADPYGRYREGTESRGKDLLTCSSTEALARSATNRAAAAAAASGSL